ncbi:MULTISPECIES: valine--tRNA ligase [Halorussus]|uniref:valine--tRNA ligase n=1 Tax=Halorussus TaxID=1070314 RepID=UPI000E21AAED|nr:MULTISPECIES: valine--tRNA ligase [Halorussus]NHN61085.1 valine--tRNA ligase [Halorussus sp. JP-T4]
MTDVPDSYDPERVEPKWQEEWQGSEIYHPEGEPDYVVDTPPPYPTGKLHLGHALGWSYMDFAARFHRLVGDEVLFPQGWDCHGLPTEVKVEEEHDIHRTEISREEFRDLCVDLSERRIDSMKETMRSLGFSQDWEAEYRTMDTDYWEKTQRSFVEMAQGDEEESYVYRDEHPVNWCPRCETAIADAEVENIDREGTLHYVTFPGVDNDDIEIATTRPELLAACVGMAVDPDDERYADRVGETFEVPLFGQEVELVADDDVDGDFGTGAVMICTFGDKQDVDWWAEHDLDLRPVFTEDGRLNDLAGEYEGLTVEEAKGIIADDLEEEGYLEDTEPTEQSVGACWRCDTPIEILSKEQWFVEVRQDEILEKAREVEWIPEHMYDRLEDWTEGMEWDWVISRQRVFATPIPAWFCANDDCEHVHVASVDELPLDPTERDPQVGECPECGGTDWEGETDVMDTWMDSSISPMHVQGWPDGEFAPTTLRQQGHDIIRTWAFYTLLRVTALEDEIPWEQALVNGMVFGEDGHKMSKSRGNAVGPEEAIEEYSADSVRQALALGGQPGSDIQFQWKEVTSASRFLTKFWNIFQFSVEHFDEDTPDVEAPAYRDADRWILSKLSRTVDAVEADMREYRFDAALRTLRQFVWEDLADDYLELVKGRLYEGRPGERNAARHALYTAVSASVRMLAPFSPHFADEVYSYLPGTDGSVHAAAWPDVAFEGDEEAERKGDLIAAVASEIRAWKSDAGMALNADLDRVEVYSDQGRGWDTYDLSEAVNAPVYPEEGRPSVELVPVGVDPDHSVIGPQFRDRAGQVVAALESADFNTLKNQKEIEGEITLEVDGEEVAIDGDAVEIEEEYRAESGEEVEVLETDDATVLVFP